jgi:conjugative transposon TraM protein
MKHSQKFLQQRKFAMVLPLLVFPFLTMIFWALGGGQGSPAQAMPTPTGLNLRLPDARFDARETWDKLSLYDQAARDSAKFEEARESDPYFDLISFKSQPEKNVDSAKDNLINSFPNREKQPLHISEENLSRKLDQLYKEINRPALPPSNMKDVTTQSTSPELTSDVNRLENMMELMHNADSRDPEMIQLENMLEKILDIQHPQRVREKLNAEKKVQETAFEVKISDTNNVISSFSNDQSVVVDTASVPIITSTAFYGLDNQNTIVDQHGNAIEAVIHDTQELVNGATVKMRLTQNIEVNGVTIPKDQLIFGICTITGERLTIEIKSIRLDNSLFPVSLSAYDMDGLEGIYVPGAISRDAAKQASEDALQNIQVMSMDPSIGAQAAGVGVEAAKGLLSKKAKLLKVIVKAGYKILLMDTQA